MTPPLRKIMFIGMVGYIYPIKDFSFKLFKLRLTFLAKHYPFTAIVQSKFRSCPGCTAVEGGKVAEIRKVVASQVDFHKCMLRNAIFNYLPPSFQEKCHIATLGSILDSQLS